jgi:hypothetical protein
MKGSMNPKSVLNQRKEVRSEITDLLPLLRARSHLEFITLMPKDAISEIEEFERSMSKMASKGRVKGFCLPCGKTVSFRFDMKSGGQRNGDFFFPNWRERLICPKCKMSNRQRLVATLVMRHFSSCATKQDVFLMEQTTPLYKWMSEQFDNHSIVGSEYFGSKYHGGSIVGPLNYHAPLRLYDPLNTLQHKFSLLISMLKMGGIRHEDVTKLSFPDASMDVIVSNDVFEHVPNPMKAFVECARVLRGGGVMITTIPFHCNNDESICRAKMVRGQLQHILPPTYHGNPVSTNGSLVFTDFGWDVLEEMRTSGFSDVSVEVYASIKFGHLGNGQLIFRLVK